MGGILGRVIKGAAATTTMLPNGEQCSMESCNNLNNGLPTQVGTRFWWSDGKCMMAGPRWAAVVLCREREEEF